jgi:uncharacterized RDD family membrane protein YckC
MENGSASGSSGGDPAHNGAAHNGADPAANGSLPLSARLLGVGVKGAKTVSRATGIDRAVEIAAEEAIVAAVESEAVERAVARVLEGPIVEEAVQGALESDAVKRAVLEAMDSEMVDEVWRRLLASDQAQQLVERIAEAPEVRAAISAQGAGLVSDIGRQIVRLARSLDETAERIARKVTFHRPRPVATNHAGSVSRLLAMLIDGVFVNLSFTVAAAAATLLATLFGGSGANVSSYAIAIGSTVWLAIGALYLIAFWSLAGRTPGMSIVGIRLSERRLPLRRAIRRVIGLGLSTITFGIGFLGILFGPQRRGWADRMAHTDVLYDERAPEPAPWSRMTATAPPVAPAVPVADGAAPPIVPLAAEPVPTVPPVAVAAEPVPPPVPPAPGAPPAL